LTQINLSSNPDWTFVYDTSDSTNQKGRLASVTNGQVTTELTYTARGEVATERTTVGGVAYALGFEYDAGGNRTKVISADGTTVTTGYAGLRPSQLTLGPGSTTPHVRNVGWYPFGPRWTRHRRATAYPRR
jgi:YD repeat-containing protein